jgi:hypothetical protein
MIMIKSSWDGYVFMIMIKSSCSPIRQLQCSCTSNTAKTSAM